MDANLVNLAKRFMASQFPVWGVDGSRHMDRVETPYFPDLEVIPDLGGSFISWKSTQGAGEHGFIDRTFTEAWRRMREYNQKENKFVARFPFHFWDYCQNHYTGSAELFGAAQGRYAWQAIKRDPGEIKLYLDAESYVSWGYITPFNNSKPMQIARGFTKEFAYLAGYKPGLYTNLGMLPYFGDFFKDMDLWIAWYNELRTMADIQRYMTKYGWRGQLCFWQYASDGDIDEDGVGDGLRLGMEEKNVDLNIWMRSVEEFSGYCGQTSIPVVTEVTSEDETVSMEPAVTSMKVRNRDGLNVREQPATGATKILSWLPYRATVNCVETIRVGADIWRKRKEGGYCAELYNGFRYLE